MRLICIFIVLLTAYEVCYSQPTIIEYSDSMPVGLLRIGVTNNDKVLNGTAFLARYKDKIFMITAKHLFTAYRPGDTATIFVDNGVRVFIAKKRVYFDPAENSSDIAIVNPNITDLPKLTCTIDSAFTIKVGDPILFLGYPSTNVADNTYIGNTTAPNGNRTALLKRGYISGYKANDSLDKQLIFDTHSAPGFSGAPVYGYDRESNRVLLIGVLAGGYKANLNSTDGKEDKLLNTLFYQTSISYGSSIVHAVQIIEAAYFNK